MVGHIFFRDQSKEVRRRKSKWAILRAGILSLYKSYEEYYDCEVKKTPQNEGSRVRRLELGHVEMESHREGEEECGLYLRFRTDAGVFEVWTDTLREYELWAESLRAAPNAKVSAPGTTEKVPSSSSSAKEEKAK